MLKNIVIIVLTLGLPLHAQAIHQMIGNFMQLLMTL
jgi:hypothetical protein